MKLIALNQKEFLVKLPFKEKFLDQVNSKFTVNTSEKLLVLGYDNGTEFLQFHGSQLTTSERYVKSNPQFDFSIFLQDDFRGSGDSLTFVLPRINAVPPSVFVNAVYYDTLVDSVRIKIFVNSNFNTPETMPNLETYKDGLWADQGQIGLYAPESNTQFVFPAPTKVRFRFQTGFLSAEFDILPQLK